MAQALKRIEKEMKYFNGDDCEEGFTAGPVDESDMFHWTASFPGTENSPYEGGTFQLKIEFPKDYPFKPPKVEFETKVYHPNVKKDTGSICLDLLKDAWSPDTKLIDVFKAIQTLLCIFFSPFFCSCIKGCSIFKILLVYILFQRMFSIRSN